MTPIRPNFENPPLIERAISVVFEPLTKLSIGDYGLFWADILAEFPTSEAMEPVAAEVEQFENFRPRQVGIQLVSAGMLPRAAFRNAAKGELVQLQNDRFGFNWIKTSDDHKYPHFEATVDRFFGLLDRFSDYARRRDLGHIKITQCELTNVNVVLVTDVGESFADIATVLKLAPLEYDCANIRLEQQLVGSKHMILSDEGQPIGRVHTLGQPSLKVPSNEEAYRLDISARGAPLGPDLAGARRFFDVAVSAVNAVFLASTTKAGRRFWGEIDG
ncbi:MAG: TIGR04255 family protein [Sphingomicrobium sp.]